MNKQNIAMIIMAVAIIYLFFRKQKVDTEGMTNVSQADLDSIKTLADIANKLQANGVDVPGPLNVKSTTNISGMLNIKSPDNGIYGISLARTDEDAKAHNWTIWNMNKQYGQNNLQIYEYYPDNSGAQCGGNAEQGSRCNPVLTIESSTGNLSVDKGNLRVAQNLNVNGSFNLLPRGIIVSWTGNDAPAGWAICNGQNGTPDLRSRFIIGSGQGANLSNYPINTTGGAEQVTLSIAQMPSHGHYDGAWGNLKFMSANTYDRGLDNGRFAGYDSGGVGPTNLNQVIGNAGGNQPHENRPPYYALAYIMKL
jgi:microcystin-dependent protein